MTSAGLLPSSPHLMAERGWRLRLHPGAAPPAVVAAARRAVRAILAAPDEAAIGFAFLRPAEGGWGLLVHIWRGRELLHEAPLLLPDDGGPPRRCPALAPALGTADEVMLLAREAAAWCHHGDDADAYLAEALS
jgi:hypothetical protein